VARPPRSTSCASAGGTNLLFPSDAAFDGPAPGFQGPVRRRAARQGWPQACDIEPKPPHADRAPPRWPWPFARGPRTRGRS